MVVNDMKSRPEDFCKITRYCTEHYSENTIDKVCDILNTHENVNYLIKVVNKNPTEQGFLKELEKLKNIRN